ncbi:hypothetical protein ACF1BQ_043365 [Bradyrhizobium sp. RDT10]
MAVREFQTASGPVDYGLFVGRKLCGVIEAKSEGSTLSGFSEQASRYIADMPKHLVHDEGQVRFEYVASGSETIFRDHADPDPASRHVFTFHRPETLERQLRSPSLCGAGSGPCRHSSPMACAPARSTPCPHSKARWDKTVRARWCRWRPVPGKPSPRAR